MVIILLLVGAISNGHVQQQRYLRTIHTQNTKLDKRQQMTAQLKKQLKQVKSAKATSDKQLKQKTKKEKDLQSQIDDLNAKLEAKRERQADDIQLVAKVDRSEPTAAPSPSYVAQSGCGDNFYAHYIYTHESGCSLTAPNAEGCIGIGQACPASKLYAVCPNLTYSCENKFFTNYALQRYTSWYNAYVWWQKNHWW